MGTKRAVSFANLFEAMVGTEVSSNSSNSVEKIYQ